MVSDSAEEHRVQFTRKGLLAFKFHALNLDRRVYSTDAIPSIIEQRGLFSFLDIQLCAV